MNHWSTVWTYADCKFTLHLFGPVDGKLGYEIIVVNPDTLQIQPQEDVKMSDDTIPDWAMWSDAFLEYSEDEHYHWPIRIGKGSSGVGVGIGTDRKAYFTPKSLFTYPKPGGLNVYTNGVVSDVILGWH